MKKIAYKTEKFKHNKTVLNYDYKELLWWQSHDSLIDIYLCIQFISPLEAVIVVII